jgi:hypothetical protein
LISPDEKDKARQILIDLVDENIEQIEAIPHVKEAQGAEAQARRDVARLSFDQSTLGDLVRQHEHRCQSTLLQGFEMLKKIRGRKKAEGDEPARCERRIPIPKTYGGTRHRSI